LRETSILVDMQELVVRLVRTALVPPLMLTSTQMGNGVSSPGDPLFYLHHTWLDKVWWDWQAKDKTKRLTEMGGTNIGPDFAPAFPPRPASIP